MSECGGGVIEGERSIQLVESSARGADTANQSGTLITAPVFLCHYTISDAARPLFHVRLLYQLLHATHPPMLRW